MNELICKICEGCHLTAGRTYKVQAEMTLFVTIVNDIGRVSEYPRSYFEG